MAMQILPRTPGFGEAFGTGLGAGLAQLAQDKYGQLQKGKIARQLESMGVPMSDAQYISGLPEQYQLQALSMLNLGGAEQQQQANPIQQMMSQLASQQQEQPQQQIGGSGNLSGLQNLPISELLAQLQGKQGQQSMSVMQPTQQQMAPQQQEIQQQPVENKPYRSSLIGGGKKPEQQQRAINSNNAPYLKELDKGVVLAEKMNDLANEMDELLSTGKVYTGGWGKIIPGVAQNTETQRFVALSNELAGLLASQSGVATNFKIKLAQSMKPNVEQSRSTQKALVENVRKQADKILERNRLKDELIASNNYEQPANLKTRVNELFEKESKTSSKSAKSDTFSSLNEIKNAKEGTKVQDEDTGKIYVRKGGKWVSES